ncbi:hypothetical protein SAMN04488109_1104 [Chryseolinea serpens]|uniref:Calx-beta domain-containing protein n=1 Tax=Chryseolinea serpens TaxID=947013 RepID=A0A1M5LA82_9BACT|nr:hypothetical protein [Chryseolinea serpens]SHG61918.1 hypothetical protein SAMN04488109_1104 [Chryseolinea serpens]
MKYNKAILQVMLWGLVAVVLSCETEKIIFTGPYHVRFSDTLQTLKESHSQPVKIEVHLAGPQLQDDVTATYSITGTAREGIDYTIVGDRGKVKLTRESSFGYITVQLINNSNNILRSQTLILTLTGTDHANIGVGQDGGGLGKKFIFTIQDDCILGGNYQGLKDELSVPVEDITIISTDCEEYTLSNWDIDIFQFPRERSLKFIDNGDNTLTIPDQKDATLPADSATINGSGFVDPQTHDIFMKVKLAGYKGQPEFSFKLIRD